MKKALFLLSCCFMFISLQLVAKVSVPPSFPINVEDGWDKDEDGNRSLSSSPSLFKDENFVYVYSEKQLDNLTIGITDMMGNVFHYEVTTVPACMYYAVSIASLPAGQYYFSVYQGSKYMIGVFTIN